MSGCLVCFACVRVCLPACLCLHLFFGLSLIVSLLSFLFLDCFHTLSIPRSISTLSPSFSPFLTPLPSLFLLSSSLYLQGPYPEYEPDPWDEKLKAARAENAAQRSKIIGSISPHCLRHKSNLLSSLTCHFLSTRCLKAVGRVEAIIRTRCSVSSVMLRLVTRRLPFALYRPFLWMCSDLVCVCTRASARAPQVTPANDGGRASDYVCA